MRGFKRDRSNKSSKQAKAIETRIKQMELIQKPYEYEKLQININNKKSKGNMNIFIDNAVFCYSNSLIFGPISLNIRCGIRIAIFGENGSGKSTFIKVLSGDMDIISGKIFKGGALNIGNFTQEHNNLDFETTVKDFLCNRAELDIKSAFSLAVKYYGLTPDELNKSIKNLSPGQRARLLFLLFSVLSAVNTLILDEPTNHLDLDAIQAIEDLMSTFEGIIILVSHDRYFLQKFKPTYVYIMTDGRLIYQKDLNEYFTSLEVKARKLIKMLN